MRRLSRVKRAEVRRTAHRTLVTTKRSSLEFVDDRGHRSAAQISFFAIMALLSFVYAAANVVVFGAAFASE